MSTSTAAVAKPSSGQAGPTPPPARVAGEAPPCGAAGPRLAEACRAFARALGEAHVVARPDALARYGRSTGPADVPPSLVLYPGSTEDVQAVVRVAARHGVALHPISRGRNFGYGDACAPTPGQAIVDLRRMDRILEVHEDLAYCVVEPGVTQGQLHEHLRARGSRLWIDATGAGLEASLLGNTLDRGFGHTPYGDHLANTCGMDVVLPDASLLRTGFGHYAGARATHVYRYGVGPSLDGLFTQAGLGIVTRAGLWLMPAPEATAAFVLRAAGDEDLPALVDALRELRLQDVLRGAVHVCNDLRLVACRTRYPFERTGGRTPLPPAVRAALRAELGLGVWNVAGAVYGTRAQVSAGLAALRRTVAGRWPIAVLDERRLGWVEGAARLLRRFGAGRALGEQAALGRTLLDVLRGVPTDGALAGACWRVRGPLPAAPVDPREAGAGLLWLSPVAPASGEQARELVDALTPVFERAGFEPFVTLTLITPRALCCVTNVSFDRRDAAETARAAACYDELLEAVTARGFHPYRTGPRGFPKLAHGSTGFWDVARRIKDALDPRGLVSPGRYDPLAARDGALV